MNTDYKKRVADLCTKLLAAIERYRQTETHLDAQEKPRFENEPLLQVTPSFEHRYQQVVHILQTLSAILSEEQVSIEFLEEELLPIVSSFDGFITRIPTEFSIWDYHSKLEQLAKDFRKKVQDTDFVPEHLLRIEAAYDDEWFDMLTRGDSFQRYHWPMQPHDDNTPPGKAWVWTHSPTIPGFEDVKWMYWLPWGDWSHWPTVHEFFNVLNAVESLKKEFLHQTEVYREANRQSRLPQLYPQVWALLKILEVQLWNGFNGSIKNPFATIYGIADRLRVVLEPYGLFVDSNE